MSQAIVVGHLDNHMEGNGPFSSPLYPTQIGSHVGLVARK